MDKYERMREQEMFFKNVEWQTRESKVTAENFRFDLYGRGSLLEQASWYTMNQMAGRRADRQFLVEASGLLNACIKKACIDMDVIDGTIREHYYAIEEAIGNLPRRLVIYNHGTHAMDVGSLPT